ncbi:MAG: hypothetical protein EZS28_048790, partial [Streblomastix strix]
VIVIGHPNKSSSSSSASSFSEDIIREIGTIFKIAQIITQINPAPRIHKKQRYKQPK